MPPHGQKQKRAEDKRSADDIAIESARNSVYNICTPMYKAQHIRMRNPITSLDKLYSVSDPLFFEDFYHLATLGLEEKLMSEIEYFTANIDPDWHAVYQSLKGYFKVKQSDNSNEHQ